MIWFKPSNQQEVKQLTEEGIKVDKQINTNDQLLSFIAKEKEALSSRKYLLVASGFDGQNLFRNTKIDLERMVFRSLIYCNKRELNMFWTKMYNLTKHVSCVCISVKELAYNLESAKRD